MSFRVFISYSWDDVTVLWALQTILNRDPYEVMFDQDNIQKGTELWEEIDQLLNSASCVIVILTENSIRNPNVIQEITRAHERGIPIIPLCKSTIDESKLPSFIRPLNRVLFDDNNNNLPNIIRSQIAPRLAELKEASDHIVYPRRRIRKILNALQGIENKEQKFRERLADAVLESVEDELGRASETYTIDLGAERNYLLRAEPIFANAKRVYAISLDSISTFWTVDEFREAAHEYIRSQAKHTVRLFVFHDAATAHAHSQVMNYHNEEYGSTGAVLLCSVETYKNILARIGVKSPEILDTDFAFIEADDSTILAKLGGSKLHFHTVIPRKADEFPVQHDKFVQVMDKLALTPMGGINDELGAGAGNAVLRWSPDFIDDRAIWAERLKSVFSTDEVVGDVMHHITIKGGVKPEKIINIRNKLLALKAASDAAFEDVWLGSRFRAAVQDGIYGGRMEVGMADESVYSLVLRFSSKEQLLSYLASRQHAVIRKHMYSMFSKEIRDLYEMADDRLRLGENTSEIFEQIEDRAKMFFERRDYFGTEKIDDIVKTPAHRFTE